MPTAAELGNSVSDIFNRELQLDKNQSLKVAHIISHDPNFNRKPDYWLNVFNISHLAYVRHRPVDFPTINIAACPRGEEWILAVKVPSVVNYKYASADTGQPVFNSLRGERFATDLINPANLGEDIWADAGNSELDQMHGGSDDLTRRGVFWSRNEIPSAQELAKARARLEKHYRELCQKARDMAAQGKTTEIGAEAHEAADYLHLSESWHMRTAVGIPCPNCGEMIQPNVAFHTSGVAGVCILDWRKAIAAGVKKREDVPLELRWWKDEPAKPVEEAPRGHK